GDGGAAMRDAAARAIAARGPGAPLPPTVRATLESRLGRDLGGVRIHDDAGANRSAARLHARAFTHGADIWLGAGESAHDVRLMAHEATHVVQQGAAAPRGEPAAAAPPPAVQRIPDWILEELDEYADYIPGWRLFTVVIGFNPFTGRDVERTATNLLGGLLGLVPFGTAIFDKLNENGVVDDAFEWVRGELSRLDLSLGRIERTIEAAWEDVSLTSGWDYNVGVLRRHFGALYDDVVAFAGSLVDRVMQLIKDAVIGVAEGLLAENRAWALIKKVLGHDPLRDQPVQATPVEILEDFLLLIGQEEHLRQMRERGTLQETADWIATQVAAFLGLLGQLRGLITQAWDAIQPRNLPDLTTNLRALATDAGAFLQRVWDFATTVAAKVLELIKNALLGWLATFANEVPGFHLLTVILGRNPFTGEDVPRTAENLIRGFITLLPGGDAIYARLRESGTIAGAAARIRGAVEELGISWEFVTGLFTGIWNSLSIDDLVHPLDAFQRIVDQFGEPVSRLFRFVGVVLREIIAMVLEAMNFPSDLIGSIIANVRSAIEDIKRDPVGFLLNMLAAVKQGFLGFFERIGTYLIRGLSDWMFRGLRQAGIQPPADLSLQSVLGFVLQVLGISMERIWEKLARRIGQPTVDRVRRVIDRLTGIWSFVRDVQERGVAAIWEHIQSQISGLWDMVLERARSWVMERVVNRAIQWVLSLLDITGIMPVINGFRAFFSAVQSAIEYLRDILTIVNDYVATLAAVARGQIGPGAERVERGLGNAVPVAIGFLANQFGLGNIGERIQEIVAEIRGYVDRALDWIVDRAVTLGQSILRSLGLGGRDDAAGGDVKRQAARAVQQQIGSEGKTVAELQPIVARVREQFRPQGLRSLELRPKENGEYGLFAAASPETDVLDLAQDRGAAATSLTARITISDPTSGLGFNFPERVERRPVGVTDPAEYARQTGLIRARPDAQRYAGSVYRESRQRDLPWGGVSNVTSLLAVQPAPGAGEITVRTFSGGEDAGAARRPRRPGGGFRDRPTNNSTHAEMRLKEFLAERPEWTARITRIEVSVSRSPCRMCAAQNETLRQVSALLTRTTIETRILSWESLYGDAQIGTRPEDVTHLRQDWTIGSPSPAPSAAPGGAAAGGKLKPSTP
ncbi:MAG TPA: DUF4157 domain-containing protein, partial [Longimicrobium sp.]|nr:DUF4157 domain-containing protein [Longimicrobium sp.]